MDPRDKVALVTGAGRRLGRAIALALGEAGADVVVHYGSSRREAEETASALVAMGRRSWAVAADLADPNAIDTLLAAVEERAGRLDILVNNAARFDRQPFDQVAPEDWERTLAVNLRAPFFTMQRGARLMRRSGGGVVVNLVDLSGMSPWSGYAVHGASKAGLIFLTRAAALELGPEVRVNAVAPGPILPPPGEDPGGEDWQHRGDGLPLARTGDPADVCEAVRFLIRADYVTGVVLPVDGGERLKDGRRDGER